MEEDKPYVVFDREWGEPAARCDYCLKYFPLGEMRWDWVKGGWICDPCSPRMYSF